MRMKSLLAWPDEPHETTADHFPTGTPVGIRYCHSNLPVVERWVDRRSTVADGPCRLATQFDVCCAFVARRVRIPPGDTVGVSKAMRTRSCIAAAVAVIPSVMTIRTRVSVDARLITQRFSSALPRARPEYAPGESTPLCPTICPIGVRVRLRERRLLRTPHSDPCRCSFRSRLSW